MTITTYLKHIVYSWSHEKVYQKMWKIVLLTTSIHKSVFDFFWLIKLNIIFVPYFLRMWWSYSPVRGCWFWLSCAVCRANTLYLARLQAVFMYRKIIFLSPMGVSPPHSICGFFVCQKKGQILNLGFQKSVPSVACDIFYKFP